MFSRFDWTPRSRTRNILSQGYETLQPYMLMAFAKKLNAEVFLDIGANIGYYSFFVSSIEGVDEIHAFEPAPTTFEELRANVALNRARITCHQMAVSDTSGSVRFGMVSETSGANSVATSDETDYPSVIEVPSATLDSLFDWQNRVIIMKMDVEGHEPQAIDGAAQLMQNNIVVLQAENHEAEADLSIPLGRLGLRQLCRVGSDYYYSNSDVLRSDPEVLDTIGIASDFLKDETLHAFEKTRNRNAGPKPVTVRLGKAAQVRLEGGLALFARRARKVFR